MNDQSLTDALLQLDRAISLAEANVVAAREVGLPEAADLAQRLPLLTYRARSFLAQIPDMTQPQRWGEGRRLLDQARAFQPFFAPYLALGPRVTAQRQALADQAARARAQAEAVQRALHEREASEAYELARKRFSTLRQIFADMQLQRGPGFDDAEWQDAVRAIGSILSAQQVRLSAASASVRAGSFDDAHGQLDQTLGELQAALDRAQRARLAAAMRARAAAAAGGTTVPMAALRATQPGQSGSLAASGVLSGPLRDIPATPPAAVPPVQPRSGTRTLLLIESRTGTLFRCDGRPTLVGRGLDVRVAAADNYLDLSRACDPGEAELLGVSRRHAEIGLQPTGYMLRDLGSTNGTRLRREGQTNWQSLTPQQWVPLLEGDTLQFGLLECSVSLS